jgi:hypothetical protein
MDAKKATLNHRRTGDHDQPATSPIVMSSIVAGTPYIQYAIPVLGAANGTAVAAIVAVQSNAQIPSHHRRRAPNASQIANKRPHASGPTIKLTKRVKLSTEGVMQMASKTAWMARTANAGHSRKARVGC